MPRARRARSMSKTRHSININRPVEDVFALLTDCELTGSWFPAEMDQRWTSPSPHGLGSTRHAVVTMFGRRTENDAVVTVWEPNRRAVLEGVATDPPWEIGVDFAPTDGGTRVSVTNEMHFTGPMRLLGPLFLRLYGRSWDRGLANAKAKMEGGKL